MIMAKSKNPPNFKLVLQTVFELETFKVEIGLLTIGIKQDHNDFMLTLTLQTQARKILFAVQLTLELLNHIFAGYLT